MFTCLKASYYGCKLVTRKSWNFKNGVCLMFCWSQVGCGCGSLFKTLNIECFKVSLTFRNCNYLRFFHFGFIVEIFYFQSSTCRKNTTKENGTSDFYKLRVSAAIWREQLKAVCTASANVKWSIRLRWFYSTSTNTTRNLAFDDYFATG